jgi:hypothetical protein
MVQTNGGRVALLMDQPDKVVISGLTTGTIDLNCGKQKSAVVNIQYVNIQYDPAAPSKAGVTGSVRTIQFEP